MVSTAKIQGVLFSSRLPRTDQPKMFFFAIGSPGLPARTLNHDGLPVDLFPIECPLDRHLNVDILQFEQGEEI
jgi:hypothetical protein